jgi:hypothetical protein
MLYEVGFLVVLLVLFHKIPEEPVLQNENDDNRAKQNDIGTLIFEMVQFVQIIVVSTKMCDFVETKRQETIRNLRNKEELGHTGADKQNE